MKIIIKLTKYLVVLLLAITLLIQFGCDKNDNSIIISEVLAKYKSLNGVVDDVKVDLWDTYFLNHSEIGNTHDNHTEIGWESFHNSILKNKTFPVNERITVETSDITVHLINKNTSWVKGKLRLVLPNGRVSNNVFYDSLIKTKDGWRVFNSIVNTISE